MTDIPDLIARLRTIRSLSNWPADYLYSLLREAADALARLTAEAVQALEPFQKMADAHDRLPYIPEDNELALTRIGTSPEMITVGDLRRARDALARLKGGAAP